MSIPRRTVNKNVKRSSRSTSNSPSRAVPIVAFNATFDVNMLNANLARHDQLGDGIIPTITEIPIICPYVLDKHFDKYVKGRNQRRLMPTIERYGLQLSEDNWHGATADATITGRLFLAQMEKYEADCAPSHPINSSATDRNFAIGASNKKPIFRRGWRVKRAEEQ